VLAKTIASYTEKKMNLNIGIQSAMLVSTNKTMVVRRFRMTPTKRAKRGKDERRRMSLPIGTLKGLKREKFSLL
jgi:hypothetical protein